ncbi:hypothetical protein GETHLI_26580 [Geothrix limicola]|uniref:ChrR-like cupin domain-containing protein n=1 Tax=Geothrix limicola TaxID=2927978 RepID=A0ABQ5QIK0_9BACT|nr:cupin domain-containing protein [Geothrix limicola]GLH74156.1 hypothetical protein GETHLI_26580 [Geothrix limicola]
MTTASSVLPVDTARIAWIPLAPGLSFKPITYFPDLSGWQLLLRLEPGTVIPRHRHTGEVHAFNLSGTRRLDTGEIIGPGMYVHEPAGNEDSWEAIGDEPCIVHIEVNGRNEYYDAEGRLVRVADARASRQDYLDWCATEGVAPHPTLAGC